MVPGGIGGLRPDNGGIWHGLRHGSPIREGWPPARGAGVTALGVRRHEAQAQSLWPLYVGVAVPGARGGLQNEAWHAPAVVR